MAGLGPILCSTSGFTTRLRRKLARQFGVWAAVFLALSWLLPFGSLSAQSRTTAALRGSVTRVDDTPVTGAVVEVRNESTGGTWSALTNEEGRFLVLLLPPGGPYTISVSYIGLSEERVEGVVLRVGEAFRLNLVLREEPIELPGIEVAVERARVFDPAEVGPATRIAEGTLESLPIMSRDVMELALISPLVKATESGGFSVAGQNDRYNAVLVDGLVSKDMFGLTSGGVPGGQAGAKLIPIDAVSQYEVLIAPFDVRLSGFTGGVLNAVTRSGTNEWRVRASAVHRNEALIGDLSLPTGPVAASGVDRSLMAVSVGGPVIRDAVHVFVAGEFEKRSQPPSGFNLFRDDPSLIRISEEAVESADSIFSSLFQADIGRSGPYPLKQNLANVFGRLDWNLEGGHRLTIRHLFAHASNDQEPNRSAFLPYELSSNGVFRNATNHLTSLQLFSEFGERYANELDLVLQRTTDGTSPASDLPQMELRLISSIDGTSYARSVRAGGQFFAQLNDLAQTSLRITNSLDVNLGGDVLTLGITGSWYGITHAFLPGAAGEYYFASLGDLELNAPERYQRTVLAEGETEAVSFDVLEWGAFAQREIHAGKGLTMHFGLRVDTPHLLGRPERNVDLEAFFGYNTSTMPSGNFLISPRWGFNWQSGGRRNTQVRGGAGMFSGQIPYVWLSNAFHNNGLRSVTRICEGRWYEEPPKTWAVPPFDPSAPPVSCDVPSNSVPPFRELRSAVLFSPDFRYPQDIKFSVVVDRELTDRISGSLGLLFNKAYNQVGLRDLNLEPSGPTEEMLALAGHERRYYQHLTEDYQHALLVTNEGEDWGASLTAEMRGLLSDGFAFQLGYTLAGSWDRTSLVFTDMLSNFGSNPSAADINKPPLETSNFDRPHKVVAAVFGTPFPWLPDTELSVLYTGQSGLPFSYVYDGDVNGDGYPGLGSSFDRNNDLIFLPDSLDAAPMSLVTKGLLSRAMREDECLARFRGRTLRRNACRSPWQHRLDVRVSHTIHAGGAEIRLGADVINFLNLLNHEWGRVERTQPVLPLLELCRGGCGGRGPLPATWGGAVLPERDEDGRLRPTEPWTVATPESQWQMQIGAQMTFGVGRH